MPILCNICKKPLQIETIYTHYLEGYVTEDKRCMSCDTVLTSVTLYKKSENKSKNVLTNS